MERMEELRQGEKDMEKVFWAQIRHSKWDDYLGNGNVSIGVVCKGKFSPSIYSCNDIHYSFYMQSLASLPVLTPVSAILYTTGLSLASE